MNIANLVQKRNYKFTSIAVLLSCVGLYGIVMVFLNGQEHSYGVSREVPLGLLLIGYAFFVGVSVGLSVVSTLTHVSNLKLFHFKSTHIALLSLTTLIAAFYLIFWELGGPFEFQVFRFIKYYTNFELSSPIWWMSTFYILETPLLALEIYLLVKGDKKAIFYAGIVGFFLGLIAFSTLSMVFAVNGARAMWHSSQFTISFVLGALVCGVSVALLFTYLRQKSISEKAVKNLSNMIFIFLVCIAFIHAWTAVISLYQGGGDLSLHVKVLTNGALSFNYYFFEILIGVLLPLVLIIIGKFKHLLLSSVAAFCAIVGAFFGRYDAVVGGQLIRVESAFVPNLELATYMPTLSEISIFISAFGVAMLLYEIGNMWLKLDEGEGYEEF